jgi:hypothetical protein
LSEEEKIESAGEWKVVKELLRFAKDGTPKGFSLMEHGDSLYVSMFEGKGDVRKKIVMKLTEGEEAVIGLWFARRLGLIYRG